ncbi:MAG: nicotinamide mononucleotide transporter [Rhodothermales bacterium]|nr:nicotinamide mononucleotide transporter [Rhodothermales bacterium]MBO6781155.1 nicotinamide mononucleotide transporter [Rhodothermales bacterium]
METWLTWENLAVVLAVAYLLLAMRENIWCWLAAFLSTAIYTFVFWNVSLVMESALNVFYMGMAVYGWWQWTHGGQTDDGVAIHTWSARRHIGAIGLILALTLVSGSLLGATEAARPFVDSFTTMASVVTTFMVARKVLENWLYWVVIDVVSIWLYLDRGLQSTAALFALYVVLAVVGFVQWRRRMSSDA